MTTIEELKNGLEKIGYTLTRDLGGYRNIINNQKETLDLVVFGDESIKFEINENVKGYIQLKYAIIKISDEQTFSIGSDDSSSFIQLYNFDR